ncbi:hypothetical protein ACU8KH_01651 [Lachancea thermotolerans]
MENVVSNLKLASAMISKSTFDFALISIKYGKKDVDSKFPQRS